MMAGTVKWYNGSKGYGFISPDEGGADVFVHVTALERSGLTTLNEGQRVAYELHIDQARNKSSAINIRVE